MTNTIRKVMIVVPVLMTSCQVSENPKTGPLTPQTMTMAQARMNVTGFPAACAMPEENWVKSCVVLLGDKENLAGKPLPSGGGITA
jgi:hypothetical protein